MTDNQNLRDIEIPVIKEDSASLPTYGSSGASGADVRANIKDARSINPREVVVIPTGLKFEIPKGFEIQVRPRSGLAIKGMTVINTPGTIDHDYRGELKVILINHGSQSFIVEPQMRIAQLVVQPVMQAAFVEVESLATSLRGQGGFGSTGLH